MGSINLNEAPVFRLNREARRRVILLSCILVLWVLCVGIVVTALGSEKTALQTKHAEIEPLLAQSIMHLDATEKVNRAHCVSRTLKNILSQPISGIRFTSIAYNDAWEMRGHFDSHENLRQAQLLFSKWMTDSEWVDEKNSFQVKGKALC